MRRALNTALEQRRLGEGHLGEGLALSAFVFLLLILLGLGRPAHAADQTILNVSYDPARELYQEYDAAFAKYWKAKTGDNITIQQSHGGPGGARLPGGQRRVITRSICWHRGLLSGVCTKGYCPAT